MIKPRLPNTIKPRHKIIIALILKIILIISIGLFSRWFWQTYDIQSPILVRITVQAPIYKLQLADPRPRHKLSLNPVGIAYAQAPDPSDYLNSPTVQGNARWKAFVEAAIRLAPIYDYPVKVMLAQAALESAHGTSGFSHDRYNYFGINAVDSDPDNANGYITPEECIIEYMHLIKTKYADAYASRNNPVDMIQAIKDDGYASDDHYVEKIMNTPEWQQL